MKKQITAQIDEELIKEMEKIRDETGLPISRQVAMRLKGYEIKKKETGHEADMVSV